MPPTGIRFILPPGTRVPLWVRAQDKNVECYRDYMRGKPVRVLRIRRGDGGFLPGGITGIRIPGSSEWRVAFDSSKVLVVLNGISGRDVKQLNWHLCEDCMTNTGKLVLTEPGRYAGQLLGHFRCTTCGSEYERQM